MFCKMGDFRFYFSGLNRTFGFVCIFLSEAKGLGTPVLPALSTVPSVTKTMLPQDPAPPWAAAPGI